MAQSPETKTQDKPVKVVSKVGLLIDPNTNIRYGEGVVEVAKVVPESWLDAQIKAEKIGIVE